MKPIPPDSIEFYDNLGDGPDSVSTRKTFSGTVNGRLTATFWNDIDVLVTIPLSGIRVRLREADLANFQTFGETYTNEDGYYSITYSKSQLLEGDNVELFLEFKSYTSNEYNITASNFWGNRFEERTSQWSASQNAGTMIRNHNFGISSNAEPFKAIHLVKRGFQYFDSQGVGLQKNLRIRPFVNSSEFGIYNFIPTIYLKSGSGHKESTVFHEYGHFAEYRLQNNHSTPYYREGTSHS